jgi:glutamine amidotransferase
LPNHFEPSYAGHAYGQPWPNRSRGFEILEKTILHIVKTTAYKMRMTQTLAIIDYGSGNLRSAAKSFERVIHDSKNTKGDDLDFKVVISSDPDVVRRADRIVLPGQGAFGDCITNLRGCDGMIEALEARVLTDGVPFLGICVGMQLLADEGLEHGHHKGLGWIPGRVVPLAPNDPALKIPHMGWNTVCSGQEPQVRSADGSAQHPRQGVGEADQASPIKITQRSTESSNFSFASDEFYYFVHSFMVELKDRDHVLGTAEYGGDVAAIIGRDNIIGTQFHPEKSQDSGLNLLANFLRWKP